MPVPDLDAAQRRAALARAAQARRVRAEVKQMLKSGEVTLREVLERAQTSEHLARMRVAEVLAALPSVGPVKAGRAMDEAAVAPTRRLRGLGARQRAALLERFDRP